MNLTNAKIRPFDLPGKLDSHPHQKSREGGVLFFVIGMLGLASLMAFTSYTLARMDFKLARNEISRTRAFMNADAGIQHIKNQLEVQLAAGIPLSTLATDPNISDPDGITFDPVTSLIPLADTNLYVFTVTGRDTSN